MAEARTVIPPAIAHPVAAPRPLERARRALQRVLALAFIAAVGLNFANVICRYVLGQAIPGADELQVYAMLAMAFLGAVLVSARHAHLRMDLLAQRLPPALQVLLRRAEGLLTAVLCGFVALQSSRYVWQMLTLDMHSDDLRVPMWLPHSLVAVGFALMGLLALARLFGALPEAAPTRDDPETT